MLVPEAEERDLVAVTRFARDKLGAALGAGSRERGEVTVQVERAVREVLGEGEREEKDREGGCDNGYEVPRTEMGHTGHDHGCEHEHGHGHGHGGEEENHHHHHH